MCVFTCLILACDKCSGLEHAHFSVVQTNDIIEYLKRLCKTMLPEGIDQFIKVRVHIQVIMCN